MTVHPLRGFGLGLEIAAGVLWLILAHQTPTVVRLFGYVQRPDRAVFTVAALQLTVLTVIGSYLVGTLLNIHSNAPVIPSSWLPVLANFGLAAVALAGLALVRYVKPPPERFAP